MAAWKYHMATAHVPGLLLRRTGQVANGFSGPGPDSALTLTQVQVQQPTPAARFTTQPGFISQRTPH